MQWYLFLAFLFILSISVFALQNSQQVTLRFLTWDLPPQPLVMVILFSAATGVLITLLFSITKQLRQNMRIRDLQHRVKQMEKHLPSRPGHEDIGSGAGSPKKPRSGHD